MELQDLQEHQDLVEMLGPQDLMVKLEFQDWQEPLELRVKLVVQGYRVK